jgi:anti-sigma regulatory factor (Ser/Thr protein kinase)
MKEYYNDSRQNQHPFIHGLIKGDLKKIEKLPQTNKPEDITIDKFTVNASSVMDLMRISNQVKYKLMSYGVPAEKIQNLMIALIETINNAQQHSYQFAKDKIVVINLFKICDDYFWIGIESMGVPIPLNKIISIVNENNPLKIGARSGRGYIIMNNAVDVIYVSHYKSYTEVFLGIFNINEMKN